jgi:hypothetical protein
MTAKDYLDPKGYWGDPAGNIRRMSGEQEIIATVAEGECSEAEWKALCSIAAPKTARPTGLGNVRISDENP